MKIIDNRKKNNNHLNLTPGSIIEDRSGIWMVNIDEDEDKGISCIKSYTNDWVSGEIAISGQDDDDLVDWFDRDAHNLNARLVIDDED